MFGEAEALSHTKWHGKHTCLIFEEHDLHKILEVGVSGLRKRGNVM